MMTASVGPFTKRFEANATGLAPVDEADTH